MNYEDISWHEINMAVTCIDHNCEGWSVSENNMSFYHCGADGNGWEEVEVVDYSKPENAWPIITENHINLSKHKDDNEWFAFTRAEDFGVSEFQWKNKDALLAAMICFLKMKDAKNENSN